MKNHRWQEETRFEKWIYSPPWFRHHLELFHKELVEDLVRDDLSSAFLVGFFKDASWLLLLWGFTSIPISINCLDDNNFRFRVSACPGACPWGLVFLIFKIETQSTRVVQVVKVVVKQNENLTCEPASWTCSIWIKVFIKPWEYVVSAIYTVPPRIEVAMRKFLIAGDPVRAKLGSSGRISNA